MARAFYSYEVGDQDLDWLISNFLSEHPDFLPIESGNQPIVLIAQAEELWDITEEDLGGDFGGDFGEEDVEEIA